MPLSPLTSDALSRAAPACPQFWTGPEIVSVPANSSANYTLTFRPLTMSAASQPHEGSIFFPIPDGTGLLYRLEGRAEKPVEEGRLDLSVPAKTSKTLHMAVHNWLNRPQRFRAVIERAPGGAGDSVRLEGNQIIDVPALSKKDYSLVFYSYVQVRGAGQLIVVCAFAQFQFPRRVFAEPFRPLHNQS